MRTIRNFERALGRVAHWPPRNQQTAASRRSAARGYDKQLKMYPHFMRQTNAFYDPHVGFCFGYFPSGDDSPFPGTCIFSCLSQDVIAHELTHALLLGMNIESLGTNPDVMAFHETFADLIRLFQHFWKSDVLRAQITAIRGNPHEQRARRGRAAVRPGDRKSRRPSGARVAAFVTRTDVQAYWIDYLIPL